MANELAVPTETQPTANGQPARSSLTRPGEAETTLQRTARILAGDIRTEDYLSVPEDLVTFVADAEARGGVPMLPEYRQLMILDLALQHHHAGNEVLCRFLPEGVIVLASGPENVSQLWVQLSESQKALVSFSYPATLI